MPAICGVATAASGLSWIKRSSSDCEERSAPVVPMTKAKGGRRRSLEQTAHPFAELAGRSAFSTADLEVLAVHHQMLSQFCTPTDDRRDEHISGSDSSRSSISLALEQYCVALSTLVEYGDPGQQFEYLFHTYATETERSISRAELFELLQDHYADSQGGITPEKTDADAEAQRTRHFERLYTWLKKHLSVYDKQRTGALPLRVTWEMLQANAMATRYLRLQVTPFIAKLRRNNLRFQEKAAAADVVI